jgi:hypothetical protein
VERAEFFMPRQKRAVRYAGRCPAPRQGDTPWTPGARFPFCPMFQNGPDAIDTKANFDFERVIKIRRKGERA